MQIQWLSQNEVIIKFDSNTYIDKVKYCVLKMEMGMGMQYEVTCVI